MAADALYELEMARAELRQLQRACTSPLSVALARSKVWFWEKEVEKEIRPELDSGGSPL